LRLKLANYSVDEIAEIRDEDKKKVENALYRGRRKIKKHYLKNRNGNEWNAHLKNA